MELGSLNATELLATAGAIYAGAVAIGQARLAQTRRFLAAFVPAVISIVLAAFAAWKAT